MEERFFKLIVNVSIWFSMYAVFLTLYAYKHDLTLSGYVPDKEILSFFNSSFAIIQVIGAVLVFTVVSFLRHRYSKPGREEKISQLMNMVLSEISSMFFSFGSVNFMIG